MERISINPREDAGKRLESIGLSFHGWDNYWKEDVCYRFSAQEVDEIERVTEELHLMCKEAASLVISKGGLGLLGIPERFHGEIERSFKANDLSVYGRFDLALVDGQIKMLEYNADTPTSLLESAVAQWNWLEDVFPDKDQFNSLHEKLIDRWKMVPGKSVHVASLAGNEEDWVCASYMVDVLLQAGKDVKQIAVEDIGWDRDARQFVGEDDEAIETMFKLYPWEWMMTEDFGAHVIGSKTRFVEPIWKSIISNKAFLAVLWELFPGHPNLLRAQFSADGMSSYAKKPFFSREGANVELVLDGKLIANDTGSYGKEGFVYQELCVLPEFSERYPVIGSWVVGDQSAGMCIREDVSKITTNMSNFVPHFFD